MKHATKIGLIAAVVLILLGALVFAGVMAANHWDFMSLGKPVVKDLDTRSFDVSERFENISIRSDTADISFLPSENGKCSVVFCVPSDVQTSASVQGGMLTVEESQEKIKTGKWYEHFSLLTVGSSGITVYLPQAEYDALVIDAHTGDIDLPGAFTFNSIDIAVTTGRVELRRIDCAGDLRVKVSTGKAFLTDVSCRNLVSSGSTGDLSMENVSAAESITVERSTGDVRLARCDAAEIRITTDTGDVTGTLRSEKVFLTQTDTGRVEVPQTTSGGACTITTDTGDIKISMDTE